MWHNKHTTIPHNVVYRLLSTLNYVDRYLSEAFLTNAVRLA